MLAASAAIFVEAVTCAFVVIDKSTVVKAPVPPCRPPLPLQQHLLHLMTVFALALGEPAQQAARVTCL
jgi:hypothetical protein